MFKKLLINGTTTTMFAATSVKSVENEMKPNEQTEIFDPSQSKDMLPIKCRPSELPLYDPVLTPMSHDKKEPKKQSELHRIIEENVRFVRIQLESTMSVLTDQSKKIEDFIETGKAHSKETVDYLRDPKNRYQQFGAIAGGGFTGYIYGAIRGGFIKKIFYAAVGAGGIASICYPEEAKIYSQEALVQAKKGLTIAYNFARGAKPGDEVSYNNPVSKFPTNYDELSDLATDLYKNAKETLFSSKK